MSEKNKEQAKEQEEAAEQSAEQDEKTEENNQQTNDTVPYRRFKEVIDEKNEYKQQLDELKTKLENMEDPEEIKQEYESTVNELKESSTKRAKEFAVKEEAMKQGARKEALSDIVKVADLENLQVNDDGQVVGQDKLIENMKETKDFYFTSGKKKEVGSSSNPETVAGTAKDDRIRKILGLPTK